MEKQMDTVTEPAVIEEGGKEPEPQFEAKSFYRNVFRIALPIALQGLVTSLVDLSLIHI